MIDASELLKPEINTPETETKAAPKKETAPLFRISNDLSKNKKDLIRNPELEPDSTQITIDHYVPWVINRIFSKHVDSIMYANEINQYPHLDKLLQYDFFLNSLRPVFRKTPKKEDEKSNDVKMISDYYKVNYNTANEYLGLMSSDDLKTIRKKFETGGIQNGRKN